MLERSVEQQEADIYALLRQAKSSRGGINHTHRQALEHLIDLSHSSHDKLKITAANHIPTFFSNFSDLEEEAINAVYDLCEDPSSAVRIRGYHAITAMSKAQTKGVKRNADVLIQLLQLDDPEEARVVEQALIDHINLDPQITLGVFCDQIVPADEPMDEEDKLLRDRLRELVITFLTTKAQAVIVKCVTPGSATEDVLVKRLIHDLPKLSHAQINALIAGLLCHLPVTTRRTTLEILLDRAEGHLSAVPKDQPWGEPSEAHFYLKAIGSMLDTQANGFRLEYLQKFYASLIRFMRSLSSRAQITVISWAVQYYKNFEKADIGSGLIRPIRKQLVDLSPTLIQTLLTVTGSEKLPEDAQEAVLVLLRTCRSHQLELAWAPKGTLLESLKALQSLTPACLSASTLPDVKQLARLLTDDTMTPPPVPPPQRPQEAQRPASAPPPSSKQDPSPASTKPASVNPSERWKITSLVTPAPTASTTRPSSTAPATPSPLSSAVKRDISSANGESPQPPKRMKNEGGSSQTQPQGLSLLDRLRTEQPKRTASPLLQSARPTPFVGPEKTFPLPRQQEKKPAVAATPNPVLSIKGAAKRASIAETAAPTTRDAPKRPPPEHRSESASLLQRLERSDGAAPRAKKRRNQ